MVFKHNKLPNYTQKETGWFGITDHSLAEGTGDILLCYAVLKQTYLWEGWVVILSLYRRDNSLPFFLGCVPYFKKSCRLFGEGPEHNISKPGASRTNWLDEVVLA